MYRTLLVGVWLSSGRSNVKVPHLALQGVSTEFVLIETHREGNVPHVARNVWLSGFQMFVLFEVVINEPTFPLSHTSNVRYIAFSMRTNTLLTPSKVRAFTSHEFLTLNYIGVRSQLENQRKCNVRYIAFPKCIRKIRIIRVQNIRHLRAGCPARRACEKTAKYKTLKYCTFQKKFVTLQPVRCSVRLRFRLIIRKYNI